MGNVYITSGTVTGDSIDGGITVKIDCQKVDHNINKTLIEFNIPTADAATAPIANIIDLKQIKHVVSLQGVLANDSAASGLGGAFTKKTNLMKLMGYAGAAEDFLMAGQTPSKGFVTLVYGQSAVSGQHKVTGNIVKIMITETPEQQVIGDGGSSTKTHMGYAVQVQVAVGKNRMGGTN